MKFQRMVVQIELDHVKERSTCMDGTYIDGTALDFSLVGGRNTVVQTLRGKFVYVVRHVEIACAGRSAHRQTLRTASSKNVSKLDFLISVPDRQAYLAFPVQKLGIWATHPRLLASHLRDVWSQIIRLVAQAACCMFLKSVPVRLHVKRTANL